MILFVLTLCLVGVYGKNYTLPGECLDVKVQQNFDYTNFTGRWYRTSYYDSDGEIDSDCGTLDIQENYPDYTLTETYIDEEDGNRTQKTYSVKIEPSFAAGNVAQFTIKQEVLGVMMEVPFIVLSTDYDNYAVAYYCKWLKEKNRMHFIFTWVLTRSKEVPKKVLKKIAKALYEYEELFSHKQDFVYKYFTNDTCAYSQKVEIDFYDTVFFN